MPSYPARNNARSGFRSLPSMYVCVSASLYSTFQAFSKALYFSIYTCGTSLYADVELVLLAQDDYY